MFSTSIKSLGLCLFMAGLLFLVRSDRALAEEPPAAGARLTQTQISQQLQDIPGWKLKGQQLSRTFYFKNFVDAIAFVNRLVEPAETAGHHPDLSISYNRVTVSLTTHDAGGLTQKDFDLARKISQVQSKE
jgi:4a-hydroxytetrahydrobiopterin dehydratase